MLIPLRTDAPVYHYPISTIGLMVISVVAHVLSGFGLPSNEDLWVPYALSHGDGLHPLQWVTSNFIHLGPLHLIGNLIFLWGFGLVVEGKTGWWRFLLIYLAIGVTQCAAEQTMMLGFDAKARVAEELELAFGDILDIWEQQRREELEAERIAPDVIGDIIARERQEQLEELLADSGASEQFHGSGGASSILYGLMAICLVWAPKNEITVLLILLYRGLVFEVTIMAYTLWYVGLEIVHVVFSGFSMTSGLLHVMGAVLGGAIGVAMFKLKMVDCEQWDIFAVMSGKYGPWARDMYGNPLPDEDDPQVDAMLAEPKKRRKRKARGTLLGERRLETVRELIVEEDWQTAADELHNARQRDPNVKLDEQDLKSLAVGLAKKKQWDEAVPLMLEYVNEFPDDANPVRLRLANAQWRIEKDRNAALTTLRSVDREQLTEGQQATFRDLSRQIQSG